MKTFEILFVEDNQTDIELTLRALKINNISNNIKVIEDGEDPRIKSGNNHSLNVFLERVLSRFQPLERLLPLKNWNKLLSLISR